MTREPEACLRVRVVPRAARAALGRDATGQLRAHVTAPPVEGAANRALLELLAECLELPKTRLTVRRGQRARDKLVAVHGCTEGELAARLTKAIGGRR